MSEWTKTPFSAILVDSKDGEWGEDAPGVGLSETSIVRGTDFQRLNTPDLELPRRWVSTNAVERKRLRAGDIIIETAGGTSTESTGRTALVTQRLIDHTGDRPLLCASFARHLRLNTQKYHPTFVYYVLQALHRGGYMAVFNIQHTGVSRFQYTAFKNHTELALPERPEQEKIAAVLSSYDEMIETNNRRIALLEKLAEEIYREWFVRFRFPGHQGVPVVKGAPQGWSVQKFGEFCRLKRGYDLPDAKVEPGPYPVLASTSIKTYHSDFKAEPPVITTGRSGSLGTVLYVNERAWPLNTALYVKRFFGNSPFLVYYTLKNMHLENFNSGAGVPTLNRNHLNGLPIVVADKPLQKRFDDVVAPLHHQRELVSESIGKLVTARDLLLPRLISGKLPLESLDIKFPPAMAEELKEAQTEAVHA